MVLFDEVNLPLVLASVAFGILSYLWYQRWQYRKQYPDGPASLPIIGNLHQMIMAGGMSKFLEKYRKIHGNVFTIEFAGVPRVVVSGPELFHELFIKHADITSGRTPSTMEPSIVKEATINPGLFWAHDPHWKELRTFVITFLRGEGMGKLSMESKILKEIEAYKKSFLDPNANTPFDVQSTLGFAVADVIVAMIFGSRMEYDNPFFVKLLDDAQKSVSATVRIAITSNIPLIKYLPGDPIGMKEAVKQSDFFIKSMQDVLDEGKKTLDPENPSSLIHHYLIHREKELKKNPNTVFTEGNLRTVLIQLFIAGAETTTTALRWALLYMCKRPDVQRKVGEEIDQQIGCDRSPTYADRNSMPYTQAVLAEVLRIGNIAPTSLPHTLSKDMVFEGKAIPAGSELMMNMTSALHDGQIFTNPELFNPDRFLQDPDLFKSKSYVPFSLGRRVCIGEGLARVELFLFFTSFLQSYIVSLPEGEKVSTEGVAGITNAPQAHKIIFTLR